MAVYRFRLIIEDHEDVYRDIEIKASQTFEDFHHIIQKAVNFDGSQMASFYMSDDVWRKGKEITLMDMSENEDSKTSTMANSALCDFIDDPHQKIIYVFDFLNMWTFYLELIKIIPKEEAGASYPRIVKSVGVAPKQYKAAIKPPSEDDDDLLGMKKKQAALFEAFEEEYGVDEAEGEEEDEFGAAYDEEELPEGEEGVEKQRGLED